MHRGYIRLFRKLVDSSFYRDSQAVHLAIHLLLQANHKPRRIVAQGHEVLIPRGGLIAGREQLSLATGIPSSTIRRKLLLLEKLGFLQRKANNQGTIITLCHYEAYQSDGHDERPAKEQQTNNAWTTDEQPMDTPNNVKNDKNEKNGSGNTIAPVKEPFQIPKETTPERASGSEGEGLPSGLDEDTQAVCTAWLDHLRKDPANVSPAYRRRIEEAIATYLGPYSAGELIALIPDLPRQPYFGTAMVDYLRRARAGPDEAGGDDVIAQAEKLLAGGVL